MKFCVDAMRLKVTSMLYYLVLQLQVFRNGKRLNCLRWVQCFNRFVDSNENFIVLMALKMTSIIPQLALCLSVCSH
jgi:hypothetical protein